MASIERIKVGNETHFIIHNNGKKCTLTTQKSIKILLDICHKHNRYFGKTNKLENADSIIKEFDALRANKKKPKLQIMSDCIDKLMDKTKVVRRMPLPGKIIISTTLAATIGLTSIGINSISRRVNAASYIPTATVEEFPEYIGDFEDIEMSSPDINYSTDQEYKIKETEISQMMQEQDAFHFSYTDRTNEESLTNAKRYEDLFIKYGNMYGVDSNLLMAMAAQESAGNHYDHLKGNYGIGIMQIEKNAHIGSTLSAYNFETGEIDKIKVTQEAIEDLETNIKIGTIILRNNIEQHNYNIPLALQSYNFGPGNMSKVITNCSESTGISKSDLKNNVTSPEWLDYRNTINVGDSKYVEHVFSYIPSGTVLTMKDRDGNSIEMQVVNDNVMSYQMG